MAKRQKTGGRTKGTPNKISGALKDDIINAAVAVGDGGDRKGMQAFLEKQARDNPVPYLSLLGRVLPMTVAGDKDNPIRHKVESDAAFAELVGALEGAARIKSGGAGS